MNIKKKRESRGLTQNQIGKVLKVNRSTVAMWESGKSKPRADLIPKLAAVLGCSIEELFAGAETGTR